MKQISLKGLSLTNFRSFSSPTTIAFSTGAGLKLITGTNEAEPRLGANGCGKSTIWDAVCFALYGTSVKGLRAADLITDGAEKVEVSLVLDIDGSTRVIHRTASPMRIHLDEGEPYDQDGIDRLVGLSKTRFLNSVIFGQSMPLFIDLPVPARGDLLDEVLDLELWMQAAGKATERHRDVSNTLIELQRAIARTTGRIDGIGDLDRFTKQREDWRQGRQARLDAIFDLVNKSDARLIELETRYHSDELKPVDEAIAKERCTYYQAQHTRARERLTKATTELEIYLEQIRVLEDNATCPTCEQPVTTDYLMKHNDRVRPDIEKLEKQAATARLDIQTTRDELTAAEITHEAVKKSNEERRSTRSGIQYRMEQTNNEMERLEKEAERLVEEVDPFAAEAERARKELAELKVKLAGEQTDAAAATSQQTSFEYWRQGFRKVRLYCIERVLAELTIETRNSLLALGLVGWQVDFQTAAETRSGTVKLGVQVDIKAPAAARKFETMSGGESQRARLAVSLGLANLIQRWAGVRFDLEVLDEPTAWLSEQGVEDLLESLRSRAETNARSIWVCDHRALIYSGFTEIMNITKTTEGSRINGVDHTVPIHPQDQAGG